MPSCTYTMLSIPSVSPQKWIELLRYFSGMLGKTLRHLKRGGGMGEAGVLSVGTPPHEFIANFRL